MKFVGKSDELIAGHHHKHKLERDECRDSNECHWSRHLRKCRRIVS